MSDDTFEFVMPLQRTVRPADGKVLLVANARTHSAASPVEARLRLGVQADRSVAPPPGRELEFHLALLRRMREEPPRLTPNKAVAEPSLYPAIVGMGHLHWDGGAILVEVSITLTGAEAPEQAQERRDWLAAEFMSRLP